MTSVCVCVPQCGFTLHVCVRVTSPIIKCLPTRALKYLSSHLTSALGAVIHRPLISVSVHDAIVDADATVNAKTVLKELVLIRLGGKWRHRQNIIYGCMYVKI